MKKIFTILCSLISFYVSAQSEGNFTNVKLQGVANPIANQHVSSLSLNQGTTSKHQIKSTTFLVEGTSKLDITNNVSGNTKGIHLFADRVFLDLPLSLGGDKIAKNGDGSPFQLSVSGKFICTEGWVKPTTGGAPWPDYVFSKNYTLPSLLWVEQFINVYSHLPEVPSASEVQEKGQNLGEMNAILLKKLEEMTLYMIQANKEIDNLKEKVALLEKAHEHSQSGK